MKPIFCGNFEYDARQSDLERLFRKYGKVDRVDMKSGFAFIYMEDERDADDAVRALDRREFGRKGRPLRVEWTKQERGIRRPEKRAANARPSKTLFVINFDPYNTRTTDLERHFDPYGKIVNVRIRKNFAFVQFELQEDATRALEATNMSKLTDRVISVEYAVRDDDEDKRDGNSTRNRNLKGGRSPSPYRRERGSPDYGRRRSPSPYKRDRASPDYGRRRSPSPYRAARASPDYGRGPSRSLSPKDKGHGPSRSPYDGRGPARGPYGRGGRASPARRDRSRSPYGRERRVSPSPKRGRELSASPNERDVGSPEPGLVDPRASPYGRKRGSPGRGNGRSSSPYQRGEIRADDEINRSPNARSGHGDSPIDDGGESPAPAHEKLRSRTPPRRERSPSY